MLWISDTFVTILYIFFMYGCIRHMWDMYRGLPIEECYGYDPIDDWPL